MIQQLPQDVINQIAAGEVVERPASVVKELVENALDAGATRIEINILDGGREEIQIIDNGSGISQDDLPKVFWPHATSKIQSIDDLTRLYTMGFRGEALASIASVSEVTIETRQEPDATGYRYQVSGCKEGQIESIAKSEVGTSITVKKLFYTVPVRKKFVKTQSTEVSHISRVIENVALVNPDIHFVYRSQNRIVAEYFPATLHERVAQVFSLKSTDALLDLYYLGNEITVNGALGHPSVSRKNQQAIRLFVNGRPIQHSAVQKALLSGYDTLLEVGYYPLSVIFITLDPALVDVNVHPRKTEVKFTDEKALFGQVRQGVRSALQKTAFSTIIHPIPNVNHTPRAVEPQQSPLRTPQFVPQPKSFSTGSLTSPSTAPRIHEVRNPFRSELQANQGQGSVPQSSTSSTPDFRDLLGSDTESISDFIQVFDTYILYRNQDGIMILDQHAVHEKVLLERFMKYPEQIRSQQLAIPLTISITESDKAQVIEVFAEVPGFEVEDFGPGDIVVRAVPTFFQRLAHLEKRIQELVDLIIESEGNLNPDDIRTEVYKTIACKAAIKAGKHMTHQEVAELVKEAIKTDFAFSCCHGRPTMVQLNQDWFEKQFSRK